MPATIDLTWPEEFSELLPLITARWQVSGEIYFHRQLSAGKSGALVYIVDITCKAYSGLAILKLDQRSNSDPNEKTEFQRHREAFEAVPGYASKHLARIVESLEHDGNTAILSTVVARGLEYSIPWSACGYELALDVLQRLSRSLLEDWNADYEIEPGMQTPQELLSRWLEYRLDSDAGRIHRFISQTCGHDPLVPSFSFEGRWFPNPLAFAKSKDVPNRLNVRAAVGRVHGDLHGQNVLVRSHQDSEPDFFLIDLALYQGEQFLFYDHAYFELTYLLARRGNCLSAQWGAILDDLSLFRPKHHTMGLWQDDIGIAEFVRTLRSEAMGWIESYENHRLSFMESQYLLARVAVGLSFTHKSIDRGLRQHAFLYAAQNLEDYFTLNTVDWPKNGAVFNFDENAESDSEKRVETVVSTLRTEPPVEKDRLFRRMITQLPAPQKPVVVVLPFEDLNAQKGANVFASGINQELITELAKVDWLAVVSPTATKLLTETSLTGDEIARRLGAHYLVEGSVLYDDERVRINAHLVDTSSGHDLWSDRLVRDVEDVFSLQQEIASAVVGHIDWELRFDMREHARLKRGEVSVWDRVQKALWHLNKFTKKDTDIAGSILSNTIDLTPEYSLAHAAMVNALLRKLIFLQVDDRDEAKERALSHAERAVALDEQSSFAHASLARVCSLLKRNDTAIAEAELAIKLNPSAANAQLVHGIVRLANGQAKLALPSIETATRFGTAGPYYKVKLLAKAFCLYILGEKLDQAEACARAAMEGRSVDPFGHYILAAILTRTSREDDARRITEQGNTIRPMLTKARMRVALETLGNAELDKFIGDLAKVGLPD